jgi:undecaprenyl-diphosphatase
MQEQDDVHPQHINYIMQTLNWDKSNLDRECCHFSFAVSRLLIAVSCIYFAITIFATMLLQAGNLTGLLEKIGDIDYKLFSKINGEWHNSFFDIFFPFTRETFFWAPLYVFLALFVIVNFKKYGWLWVLFLILNVVLSDFVSSSLIKENIFRIRPCRDPVIADQVRFLVRYCPGSSGFTSSHAANHFAAAMFIFVTLKQKVSISKWWVLIFLWALIPCYAQIYVGVHFPTDIMGGIFAGLILGYLMGYFFNRITVKKTDVIIRYD